MPIDVERRTSGHALSPREAAFVTDLSEKTINQAIDRAEVETIPARRAEDRERMLAFPDLVYLRLRSHVGSLLSAEGKRRLRHELQAAGGPRHPDVISIGPINVHIAGEVGALREKLKEMERLWSFVTMNPDVRAGEPVVRGTRISVHTLGDLAAQGAPEEELLEDYPSLSRESLDAALAWARMYPRRGRPPSAPPWKNGVVIRRGS
jgi:uncharacterized protein (DUF433 family)